MSPLAENALVLTASIEADHHAGGIKIAGAVRMDPGGAHTDPRICLHSRISTESHSGSGSVSSFRVATKGRELAWIARLTARVASGC
jgi:hypothetical protein